MLHTLPRHSIPWQPVSSSRLRTISRSVVDGLTLTVLMEPFTVKVIADSMRAHLAVLSCSEAA